MENTETTTGTEILDAAENPTRQPVKLSRADVFKSYLVWTFFSHSTYSYERYQAPGVVHAIAPCLEKLYGKDTPELKEALVRHMEFFNTEPNLGGCIIGATLALEEQRANGMDIDPEMISNLKIGLMGPLAGVGDTIWQSTLSPIALSLILGMAQSGNLFAPLLYFIIIAVVLFGEGYISFMKGYEAGRDGISQVVNSGMIHSITSKMATIGGILLGALASSYVTVSSSLVLETSAGTIDVQANILDSIFVGILPLCVTLLAVHLLRKKLSVNKVMIVLAVIAIVGTVIGFF